MKAKPFIKWAGGKTQLLPEIEKRLPKDFNNYHEPFVGGGALLWKINLESRKAYINDASSELINVYENIKKRPKLLMKRLDEHKEQHLLDAEKYYYYMRNKDRDPNWINEVSSLEKASRFIYLNKTSFNGLWRVNSRGENNVPWNYKKNVNLYDKDTILDTSFFLRKKIIINNRDFLKVTRTMKKGDFIFFDPPYDLLNENTFESYTNQKFGTEGQKKLANLAKRLKKRGCYIMLTNHDTPLIRELYKDFKIEVIPVKRMINSDGKNRHAKEVIICSY